MTTITIGKRLIPLEQIALVEPFDPMANSKIQTDKAFKARLVLLDRDSVLSEEEPQRFAKTHGLRWIVADQMAANAMSVVFGVETFEAAEGFIPSKPYRSRLIWRDQTGFTQSKLLLSEPEALLAIAVRGERVLDEADSDLQSPPSPNRRRQRMRRREPAAQPS